MTERTTTAPARVPAPGRPARAVIGALFVDLGENRGGQWVREPRAKYECVLCQTLEGPVYGAEDVTTFTAGIRSAHRDHCTAIRSTVRE